MNETSPGPEHDGGFNSAHPSALQSDWSLRYGKPLVTPSAPPPPREYLPCIFISSPTSALPWQQTWSAQILSALAWAQVGLACDYRRMVVMRALHKAVRRVYSASPWSVENTMRAVYAIAHHQPCPQQQACARLLHWLRQNAQWDNNRYSGSINPPEFQPEGYTPAWCADTPLLLARTAP